MSKKGGYYCAFKNCRGLSRRDKRSFFRFPKDPQRSKQWVKACDRGDLLEKTPIELFNSYRVCAKHFTDSMFLNDLRNRLQPNSVPMQLEPPEEANNHHEDESSDQLIVNGNGDLVSGGNNNRRRCSSSGDELPDCQDSVAKLLSNCILQKISADEFFKATGIRINEPVSTVRATDEYLQNSSPSDHIYSSTKASHGAVNGLVNGASGALAIDIDNDNPSNYSIEALSYQDLINSLPMSLISGAPSTESSLETSDLPFVIAYKGLDKLPDNILDDQIANCPATEEACTQTEAVCCAVTDKTSQTESSDAQPRSTQTEASPNLVSSACQTESKDGLNRRKIRKLLESKEQKIRELKLQAQRNFASGMESVTLKQYELLTEKFFPRETSDFVKVQAQLYRRKTSERKYTLEFRRQCLALFLAGPRAYKSLQKLFCLPGVRDLQTLKY